MKKISLFLTILTLISCSDFLDEIPDNRTIIDTPDEVRKLLGKAYTGSHYAMLTELSSDNVIDDGEENPYNEVAYEEMAYWKDVTVANNDDPLSFWGNTYNAIATANLALQHIEEMPGANLTAEKAEALVARAYAYFSLVNVFGKHYNPKTSDKDLGVPYVVKKESTLSPKYKRNSVAEVYANIDKDLQEALPNISDDIYDSPRYHFTRNASNAFAARFYLYYGKWKKAIEYATNVLEGTSLIDWEEIRNIQVSSPELRAQEVSKQQGVLLLLTDASHFGNYFGAKRRGSRINHNVDLAKKETARASMPWEGLLNTSSYKYGYVGTIDSDTRKVIFWRNAPFFQVLDIISGAGYSRTVFNLFTTDELLLIRAEANIHLGKYDEALVDLNRWIANFFRGEHQVTKENIQDFYNNMEYSSLTDFEYLTQKKKLNPVGFSIKDKEQENMLHFLLQCRRLATLHDGLRWFDVKRYGIEVPRFRYENEQGSYVAVDVLRKDDERRALQIPRNAITSGLTPNPR